MKIGPADPEIIGFQEIILKRRKLTQTKHMALPGRHTVQAEQDYQLTSIALRCFLIFFQIA